jgi:hypothetical protein
MDPMPSSKSQEERAANDPHSKKGTASSRLSHRSSSQRFVERPITLARPRCRAER